MIRLRRLSLRTRIFVAFLASMLLLGTVVTLGLTAMVKLHGGLDAVVTARAPLVQTLHDLRFASLRVAASVRQSALLHQQARPEGVDTSASLLQEQRRIETERAQYHEALERYGDLLARHYADDQVSLPRLASAGEALLRAGEDLRGLVRSDASGGDVLRAGDRLNARERQFLDVVNALLMQQRARLHETAEDLHGEYLQGTGTLALAGIIALAAILVIAVHVAGRVSAPLQGITSAASALSSGRMDVQLHDDGEDEMGTLTRAVGRLARELKTTTVSRDFLNAVVKCMTDSLVILDTDSRVVMANDATFEMLGYSRQELYGQPSTRLLVDDSRRAPESSAELELAALLSGTMETHYQARDGKLIPVSVTGSVLRSGSGRRLGGILVAQDISERKRTEVELVESKERAEAATRAKSQFLANMSHEIRTPMNGVLGMAELLLAENLDQRQRGYAETIRRSGESLLTLINDVLDFSKIEAGRLQLVDEPFDLVEVVEDVASLLAPGAHAEDVELTVVASASLPATVRGDAARLRQVMTNLVGNAIKFTEHGEVLVRVAPHGTGQGRPRYRITVQDTGVGIPPAALPDVFEPFFQVDAGTPRHRGGTGLGLAISRHLVDLMGGEIRVQSEPGRGTAFRLTLPLVAAGLPAREHPPRGCRGALALVVSAHGPTRESLRQQLGRLGLRHHTMATGSAALDWLRGPAGEGPPLCCILVDHDLGDMSDVEFAGGLAAERLARSARVIALCRVGEEPGLAHRWQEAGIVSHLTRPARVAQLRERLALASADDGDDTSPAPDWLDPSFSARVLLAEDHPVNQDVVKSMLDRLGCETTVVVDGESALAALEQDSYDLVLMDCDMPGMDGYEVTRLLRVEEARTGRPHLPVVALTANALSGDRERCLAAGMDDYLSKPMTRAQLRQTLETWLLPRPTRVPAPPGEEEHRSPPPLAIESPIDASVIRPLQSCGEGFLAALTSKYARGCVDDLGALRAALETGDAEAVRKAAHRFKSASASLGARRVSRACMAVEAAAREGRLDDVPALADTVYTEYERALSELERLAANDG